MHKISLKITMAVLIAAVSSVAQAVVNIDFEAFKIRNNGGGIVAPWDSDLVITENAAGDGFSAQTPRGGQKVGYGTHAFDGLKVNQLESVNFNINPGSLASSYPYINLWVTDGLGNLAILALGDDFRVASLLSDSLDWLMYEYTFGSTDWLFDTPTDTFAGGADHHVVQNGGEISLSDISDNVYLIGPSNPYPAVGINGPGTGVGTGAPRGGFGFNIIFGDTAANYVGAMNISDLEVGFDGETYAAAASSVPDQSSTIMLLSLAFVSIVAARRRFSN